MLWFIFDTLGGSQLCVGTQQVVNECSRLTDSEPGKSLGLATCPTHPAPVSRSLEKGNLINPFKFHSSSLPPQLFAFSIQVRDRGLSLSSIAEVWST